MSGEKISPNTEQEAPQATEWDKLTDGKLDDIEEVSDTQDDEATVEANTEGMTRRLTKLPSAIEGVRRDIARRFAPNTMPKMEVIAADVRREPVGMVAELCENWPLFDHTEKVTIDGTEIDFPAFHPEVKYISDRKDFTGYLSTAENPERQIQQIRSEIGKKTASIFVEAALDNPLIATMSLELFPGRHNSDYNGQGTTPDNLIKGTIRLVDESLPLEAALVKLNLRLAGVEYVERIDDAEALEGIDTVERAMIAYHEMGHGIDLLTNYLTIQKRSEVSNKQIIDALHEKDLMRTRNIECSKSIPNITLMAQIASSDEMRVFLERRGFNTDQPLGIVDMQSYNSRAYREMPCEAIADDYARKAVCVKHRDHYFAKNELERQQNPEKRSLPIYGELIYMGKASRKEDTSFLDSELIGCGVIAGKRVVLRSYKKPEGLRFDEKASSYKFPDDFDYSADQKEQNGQEILIEGIIKQNPHNGVFEVVDENGKLLAVFGGQYYRQQNEMGNIDIINGDLSSDDPLYRLQFDYSAEDEKAKTTVYQCGPGAFSRELGINDEEENSILLINDNTAKRFLLPKGGFDGLYYYQKHPEYTLTSGKMLDEKGDAYDIPFECYLYNGIPKVKINGELFEVVPGSKADLEKLSQRIMNASAEAH